MFIHENPNIYVFDEEPKKHTKASETYIHVKFTYPAADKEKEMDLWIPIEYRRLGIFIDPDCETKLSPHLDYVYEHLNPELLPSWKSAQKEFWDTKPRAKITRKFFDNLVPGEWVCVDCNLPTNPNFSKRIQAIKDDGYTIVTDTKRFCNDCGKKTKHHLLLPLPRGGEGSGYETWTPRLRSKIIRVLHAFDVYENRKSSYCLPDHKFPEIRWDEQTKEENPDDMTKEKIKNKFQLMNNQRNLQKRERCRECFQTGSRGTIFGIPYFYEGSDTWDPAIPKRGKEAERGCVGCPWYDIELWRKKLIEKLNK